MKEPRKNPRLTITLDEETRRQVQRIADEVGGSAAFIVRKAVKLYVQHRRKR